MTDRVIDIVRAGRVPYGEALAWQRQLAADRIAGREPHDLLLLVEHPPVITLGRTARGTHVLRPDGVEVVDVERGGDVTYHGPGQLVGYPILDLGRLRPDLHWYLRTLEEALIRGLARLGITAERRAGLTGVWAGTRKIASIGVHVKQWITWHGFALNVTTDLAAFERIVPCGITGVEMTSVEREGGRGTLKDSLTVAGDGALWEQAQDAVIAGFEDAFGFRAVIRELAPPAAHSG